MRKTNSFRDYLYVSVRKVVRMSQTLRTPGWKRLRGVDVKVGPVGGGLNLGEDPRADDVIAMVPRVEQAIMKHFGVNTLGDPNLQVGQWVQVTGEQMSYGVPFPPMSTVLFLDSKAHLVLGGAAEYLLDRRAEDGKPSWPAPSSAQLGLLDAMYQLTMTDDEYLRQRQPEKDDAYLQHLFDKVIAGDYYENTRSGFAGNPEPLTSLARVLMIGRSDDVRTVVGTPLYVAFHVPR
jgi:hypothetical protein